MDTPARCWFVYPLGCSLLLPHQALEAGLPSLLNGIGACSGVASGGWKLHVLIHSFLTPCPFSLALAFSSLTMP